MAPSHGIRVTCRVLETGAGCAAVDAHSWGARPPSSLQQPPMAGCPGTPPSLQPPSPSRTHHHPWPPGTVPHSVSSSSPCWEGALCISRCSTQLFPPQEPGVCAWCRAGETQVRAEPRGVQQPPLPSRRLICDRQTRPLTQQLTGGISPGLMECGNRSPSAGATCCAAAGGWGPARSRARPAPPRGRPRAARPAGSLPAPGRAGSVAPRVRARAAQVPV